MRLCRNRRAEAEETGGLRWITANWLPNDQFSTDSMSSVGLSGRRELYHRCVAKWSYKKSRTVG